MLKNNFSGIFPEAGCDEAGRGCLAGPVFAAAVILPDHYRNDALNDSKKLTALQRYRLREVIEREASDWSVSSVDPQEIDSINILNASIKAMHKALDKLKTLPAFILVDGNRFHPYHTIAHRCIIRGDGLYLSIAAASILAKTYRDDFMKSIHPEFPVYGWNSNKGYPTRYHREQVIRLGLSPHHRKSFKVDGQYRLPFN